MNLGSALAIDGHATTALVDDDVLACLRVLHDSIGSAGRSPFFASANDLEPHRAHELQGAILELVGPALATVLPGHRPFLASFLAKSAGDGARIAFHQDLTYTDERSHRSVVAWLPLVDVDERNGAMEVVAASHRWTSGSRPGGLDPLPTASLQEEFGAASRLVPLTAGDALLYDAALVHGSPPNRSARPRVAVGVALVPAEADLIHLHQRADGSTSAHRVDGDYYTLQGLRNLPQGYPTAPVWAEPVTVEELRSACVPTR